MKYLFDLKEDIEYSLESKKIDLDYFAKKNSLTRKTIYNQIKNPSNYNTLNKIYNGIFDLGIRLNKVKSEIYEECSSKNIITLYHGSKRGLDNITCNGSRLDCDFGSGFYLSTSINSAISFIEDIDESCAYIFYLNIEGLKILELKTDLKWMLLICYFRKGIKVPYKYEYLLKMVNEADVIIAPIADNKMFEILNEFSNGLITTTQALHALSASSLGKQYVIKTKKGIDNIKMVAPLFVSSKEKEVSRRNSIDRANETETKMQYAKRNFRNQGQYIDELIK